jgi:hypothetical protein
MDPIETKTISIALILILYGSALNRKSLSVLQVVFGLVYFFVSLPLGYDTLGYKMLIESGKITRYGMLWETLYIGVQATGFWWFIHCISGIILVYSFSRLATTSSWPSLVFAMIITLPGIGFSFLSILRQAVATAFLVNVYTGCKRGDGKSVLLNSVLAFLSHQTSLFANLVIVFLNLKSNFSIKNKLMLIFSALLFVFITGLTNEEFSTSIIQYFQYLIDSSVSLEMLQESGYVLSVFWICLLSLPFLIDLAYSNKIRFPGLLSINIATAVLYTSIFIVSGSGVRICWYFLPIVIFLNSRLLVVHSERGFGGYLTIIYVLICFLGSVYPIAIARDYFWRNTYDQVVDFD